MKTFKMIIRHIEGGVIAVAALMVLLLLMTEASCAAESHSVKIVYDQTQGETTYSIYYMGTFGENGKFVFADDKLKDALGQPPNYTKEDFGEEDKSDEEAEQWRAAWMDAAQAAYQYVKSPDSGMDPLDTVKTSAKEFTFSKTFEDGLYLVTGTTVRKEDSNTGKVTYSWPMPMYVRVLGSDVTYSLKPDMGTASKLLVKKEWAGDDEVKDMVRPKSIKIHIFYDGKKKEDVDLPIKTDKGDQWFYSWETDKDEDDPTKWTITEDITDEMAQNYSVTLPVTFTQGSDSMQATITNTYDRKELELVKELVDYISQGNTKQTFVFNITGYAGEKEVFFKNFGLTFGEESDSKAKALVSNIPKTVDKIVVEEIYEGNYAPDKEKKEAVYDDQDGIWKVSFTNSKPDTDKPTFNTGVINKFSITGDGAFSFNKAVGSGIE